MQTSGHDKLTLPSLDICLRLYGAAWLSIVPVFPMLVAGSTVLLYIAGYVVCFGARPEVGAPLAQFQGLSPIVAGLICASLIGVVVAALLMPLVRADTTNAEEYAELRRRYEALDNEVNCVSGAAAGSDCPSPAKCAVLTETQSQLKKIEAELEESGSQWILGTGYTRLWRRLHRAEEAWIMAAPTERFALVCAWTDAWRLADLQRPECDHLRRTLQECVPVLSPEIGRLLPVVQGSSQPVDAKPLSKPTCRLMIRSVRGAINDLRDDAWEALLRTRNCCMFTISFVGIFLCLVLGIAAEGQYQVYAFESRVAALHVDAPPVLGRTEWTPSCPSSLIADPIVAATAIFLFAAMIGLFQHLYQETTTSVTSEDFGLSRVRLVLTPLLSGIAAIGGVMILQVASAALGANLNGAPAGTMAMQALATTFDLTKNPGSLVLAGMLGLTPGLLLGHLKELTEQYTAVLRRTEASGDRMPSKPATGAATAAAP